MLYDDSEQLEVRYVISLAHYDVDLYAGEEGVPDGELFIKRNCVRLSGKGISVDVASELRPFYLFSDDCSLKEDFYHAMLRNQKSSSRSNDQPPKPLMFEPSHMVKLVQQLHATEENLQTRWINALIGRIFLSMYKTSEVETFIRSKITKKIARVQKPAFISGIKVQDIDMGDSAPFVTNPRLKELTIDGSLTVEADIRYQGNFKLDIAATARIELGSRFKPRDVNIVLAGILKKLEGHVLIHIKPPPSNRLWLSFETMPKMDLSIEPIVSSRQITYGFIIRAIESRIREVFAETLVAPNADDVPFFDTTFQRYRGGIWQDDIRSRPPQDSRTAAAENGLVDQIDEGYPYDESSIAPESAPLTSNEKTMSMPSLPNPKTLGLSIRKSGKTLPILDGAVSNLAISSGIEAPNSAAKPKAMRSRSFAHAADPVVSLDAATVEAMRNELLHGHKDATAAVKGLNNRARLYSQAEPIGTARSPIDIRNKPDKFSASSSDSSAASSLTQDHPIPSRLSTENEHHYHSDPERSKRAPSASKSEHGRDQPINGTSGESGRSKASPRTSKPVVNVAATAGATAKRWGMNFVARHNSARTPMNLSATSLESPSNSSIHSIDPALDNDRDSLAADTHMRSANSSDIASPSLPIGSPSNPIGRGQPLPPPGQPLPMPPRSDRTWAGAMGLGKRKPVAKPTTDVASGKLPSSSLTVTPTADIARQHSKAFHDSSDAPQTDKDDGSPSPPALPQRPRPSSAVVATASDPPLTDLQDALQRSQSQRRHPSGSPKRRPVPKPPLPDRTPDVADVPSPKIPALDGDQQKRQPRADAGTEDEDIFVLEAPIADSAPATPAQEKPGLVLPTNPEEEGVELGDEEKAGKGDRTGDGVHDNRGIVVGLDAATDQSG